MSYQRDPFMKSKRDLLIERAQSYDKEWNSRGEPRGPWDRFRDELIDHLVELSDEEIEEIKNLDTYDYMGEGGI